MYNYAYTRIMKNRKNSSLTYILESLIPFTEANLNMTFRPNAFFNELDKRDHYSRSTLKQSFYKARATGLITFSDGRIQLSEKARALVAKIDAEVLKNDTVFMVIFDIPEDLSVKRRQLRSLLKELAFTQAQKSVWISRNDHRKIVLDLIDELDMHPYVKTFLCNPVF